VLEDLGMSSILARPAEEGRLSIDMNEMNDMNDHKLMVGSYLSELRLLICGKHT
jgi:hypothetical protein